LLILPRHRSTPTTRPFLKAESCFPGHLISSLATCRTSELGEATRHDRKFFVMIGKKNGFFAVESRFMMSAYDNPKHDVVSARRWVQRTYGIIGLQFFIRTPGNPNTFSLLNAVSAIDRHPNISGGKWC